MPDLWRLAQLNLGAVGIVTKLNLQLVDTYKLRQTSWETTIDDLLADVEEHMAEHRHFEFFWYPTTGQCVAKATDVTTDEPQYPMGPEGDRCGWNFEVLPNHRDWPHTEMEYSVPADQGLACLAAIRDVLAAEFPTMPYPIEYRSVAEDDLWISSATGRSTVTISVHMDVRQDEEACFRRCEEVFAAFEGRPHWGKVHYRSGQELAELYPMWRRWWEVRDHHDPEGTFLNEPLSALRP
jgi:FAD/FMN-containing dehydrogenase